MYDDEWFEQHQRETRLKQIIVVALGLALAVAFFVTDWYLRRHGL